ncbi:putative phosphatidate phosphatase [Drosophila tropicalis]|uniref:putative phosphatidate phosphatase n=1 Tax=Drosophila tropicalis TaxID=46794 RepID=UPI0035AC01AF
MSSLRPGSVCDTTPLQRFESQSSNGEEPSSPTAASLVAAAASSTASAMPHINHNNNNNVKVDLQLPTFVGGPGNGVGSAAAIVTKTRHQRGTSQIFRRIFLDLCLLSCVGLPMLGFSLWWEPYKRGFFCDDTSLKHPYKESTIRSWMLYLMCAALPVIMILVVEFFRAQDKRIRESYIGSKHKINHSAYHLCHLELPNWLLECYRKIGIFIFGLGVEQLTTDIAKYTIGRLRPHFFAVCQPVLPDHTTCDDLVNVGQYIENYTCMATDMTAKRFKDMQLSFPSGHTSFACYSMIFLVIYLQRRMHWSGTKMVRHLLQFLLLMFAWFTALTRVSDYKHHWSDVLAGASIGLTYAIVVTSTMW